jgi:DNA-binding response OmpR family regulator
MKQKIAIVEDDDLIGNMIKINLENNGYLAFLYSSAESLLEEIGRKFFDLFVLDIFLPGLSGLELLKKLRDKHIDTPVLILTVEDNMRSKIDALNVGADDYLVKPFHIEELLARVRALIRRSLGKRSIPSSKVLILNNFKIELHTRECDSNVGKVVLSEKEAKLLSYFVFNEGKILNRADILEEVWGMDVSPTPRTIDNFVLKFRKLFENKPEHPEHFISVRNKGYRFEK